MASPGQPQGFFDPSGGQGQFDFANQSQFSTPARMRALQQLIMSQRAPQVRGPGSVQNVGQGFDAGMTAIVNTVQQGRANRNKQDLVMRMLRQQEMAAKAEQVRKTEAGRQQFAALAAQGLSPAQITTIQSLPPGSQGEHIRTMLDAVKEEKTFAAHEQAMMAKFGVTETMLRNDPALAARFHVAVEQSLEDPKTLDFLGGLSREQDFQTIEREADRLGVDLRGPIPLGFKQHMARAGINMDEEFPTFEAEMKQRLELATSQAQLQKVQLENRVAGRDVQMNEAFGALKQEWLEGRITFKQFVRGGMAMSENPEDSAKFVGFLSDLRENKETRRLMKNLGPRQQAQGQVQEDNFFNDLDTIMNQEGLTLAEKAQQINQSFGFRSAQLGQQIQQGVQSIGPATVQALSAGEALRTGQVPSQQQVQQTEQILP